MLQRRAAGQPRPLPYRLRRRSRRHRRVQHLLADHVHPGRRRGELRPPRVRPAAALHPRQRGDDVLRARDGQHARRAARRDAGDLPVGPTATSQGITPNIDRCWTCRSMFMQAWGNYGTAWAVVHQQLGVRPRPRQWPARGRPAGARRAAERRRARTSASATARSTSGRPRPGTRYTTTHRHERGAGRQRTSSATRCRAGRRSTRYSSTAQPVTDYESRETNRGLEVRVAADPAGRHTLVVTTE